MKTKTAAPHTKTVPVRRPSIVARRSATIETGRALPVSRAQIQPKLRVGAVDDPMEREADAMAQRVISMPTPEAVAAEATPNGGASGTGGAGSGDAVQPSRNRTAAAVGPQGGAAPSDVAAFVDRPGAGRPLSAALRAFVQPRFGADFTNVRVHDAAADRAAASRIGARAFTLRHHIWLGPGESAEDGRLMAHELTHVTQQTRTEHPAAPAERSAAARVPLARDDGAGNAGPEVIRSAMRAMPGAFSRPLGDAARAVTEPRFGPDFGPLAHEPSDVVQDARTSTNGVIRRQVAAKAPADLRSHYPTLFAELTPAEWQELMSGSVVRVNLERVLDPRSTFHAGEDPWSTIFLIFAYRGSPQIAGSLIREETLRRWYRQAGISLHDGVDIALVGAEGATAEDKWLEFRVHGTVVPNWQGALSAEALDQALDAHSFGKVAYEVNQEATLVGIVAELQAICDINASAIPAFVAKVRSNFANTALGDVRAYAQQVEEDFNSARRLCDIPPISSFAGDLPNALFDQFVQLNDLLADAESWHNERRHDPKFKSLDDELKIASEIADLASSYLEKEDRGVAAMAASVFSGMFSGARFVVGALPFSATADQGEIVRAYRQGDVSYTGAVKLSEDAQTRANVSGLVTAALTIATFGGGAGLAVGGRVLGGGLSTLGGRAVVGSLGFAERSLMYKIGSASIDAGVIDVAALGAGHIYASQQSYDDPHAQALSEQFKPGLGDYALSFGSGFALEGLQRGFFHFFSSPGAVPGGGALTLTETTSGTGATPRLWTIIAESVDAETGTQTATARWFNGELLSSTVETATGNGYLIRHSTGEMFSIVGGEIKGPFLGLPPSKGIYGESGIRPTAVDAVGVGPSPVQQLPPGVLSSTSGDVKLLPPATTKKGGTTSLGALFQPHVGDVKLLPPATKKGAEDETLLPVQPEAELTRWGDLTFQELPGNASVFDDVTQRWIPAWRFAEFLEARNQGLTQQQTQVRVQLPVPTRYTGGKRTQNTVILDGFVNEAGGITVTEVKARDWDNPANAMDLAGSLQKAYDAVGVATIVEPDIANVEFIVATHRPLPRATENIVKRLFAEHLRTQGLTGEQILEVLGRVRYKWLRPEKPPPQR